MDEKDESIVETSNLTHEYYMYVIKRTLQFLVPVSVFPFLFSYFSGSSVFVSYNLQFSTPVFPLFAQVLDRKYMFLVCNGILAFLAKNLRFNNYGGVVEKSAEHDMQQVTELAPILEAATVHEDVASMKYGSEEKERIEKQEQDCEKDIEGFKTGAYVLEDVILEEEADDADDYGDYVSEDVILEEETDAADDDYDDEIDDSASVEEVDDAQVSTEELNKKFEEFIRKMKEEIRIEAQQKLIAV